VIAKKKNPFKEAEQAWYWTFDLTSKIQRVGPSRLYIEAPYTSTTCHQKICLSILN